MDVDPDDDYKPGEYCQKSKYESRWCKNRKPRDDAKVQQNAVLTTS